MRSYRTLRGSVKGGIGEYTVQWSPSEGLRNPAALVTKLDTSSPGNFTFALSVTDETGATSSDDVTINIAERRVPPTREERVRKQPDDPGQKRWDGRYMQLVMMLGQTHNGTSTNEVMVFDRKARQSSYYATGDEFDGGKLVYVHQTGGLVHRKDGYYVYPIGTQLDQDLKLEEAEMYFELQAAAERHRDLLAREGEAKAAADAAKAETDADQADAAPGAGTEKTPETGEVGSAPETPEKKEAVTPPGTSGEAAHEPNARRTAPGSAKQGLKGAGAKPQRPDVKRPRPIGRKPR